MARLVRAIQFISEPKLDGPHEAGHDNLDYLLDYLLITVTRPTEVSPAIRSSLGVKVQ